jgi:hypothetical protein
VSTSKGEKIFMTPPFVLIGLPPGVPVPIGFAIFGVLLRQLIRT